METGGWGLFGPVAGVLAMEECCEGKFAGWKRGSDGSFNGPVGCLRCELAVVAGLACMVRGEGGCMASYLDGESKRGGRGD